jgi:hypothetical protein
MAFVTLDGVDQVIRTSGKAVLVRFDDLREVWIPRSVREDGADLGEGDTDIVVAEWFAEKEGLD